MDVLARYHKAAIECNAEVVMRVTSDCPLIDPDVAGEVLSVVVNGRADYACNNQPRSWPHGLDCEAFSFHWLARAAHEAKLPEEREHVTPFLRAHPDVRRINLKGPDGDIARYRWTLDTAQDLRFLQALYERLPPGPIGFNFRVPLAIVENDPKLKALMG
jgi:spore coat polysaccharide biosynthesis protein SpsF (cytidylyltransferase family)